MQTWLCQSQPKQAGPAEEGGREQLLRLAQQRRTTFLISSTYSAWPALTAAGLENLDGQASDMEEFGAQPPDMAHPVAQASGLSPFHCNAGLWVQTPSVDKPEAWATR